MNILTPLYTDVRQYLIAALDLASDAPIVRGYQNAVPIPENGIIMTFRQSAHIDQHSTNYEDDKMIIFNSVRGFMQVDFYGENSFDKAQQIATLWNSSYTPTVLQQCVPLSTPRLRDLSFVNEQGYYELRFTLDLELQYNTKYEKTVNIVSDASDIITELNNV